MNKRPIPPFPRQGLLLALAITLALPGCIQPRLKRLEIRQLETELALMRETGEFLRSSPTLGREYDARLFIRGDLFNRFLDGLANYSIPLESPRGAKIHVERAQLVFKDGPPQAVIAVRAIDRAGKVEVKLRMRADIEIAVDTQDPTKPVVRLRFAIKEVVPDVRLSVFRLRQLIFVGRLLRLGAQQYADSLPATTIPLTQEFPIEFDPDPTTEIALGDHAKLYVSQKLPRFTLKYRYSPQRVVTLADGIHVFFKLERLS